MLAIVGTAPEKGFSPVIGQPKLKDGIIFIQDKGFPVNRGTPALLAAAIKAVEVLDQPVPTAFMAGDIGLGDGSRKLYDYLTRHLAHLDHQVITFHYLQPDVDWHNRVLFAIQDMPHRPTLIADAGFMYAAKMSGQAREYDFFTPDVGEMAFLADEEAPHPFYTRGFILHEETKLPDLIARAYGHDNAARNLLIKGPKDYIIDKNGILATIDSPSEEALEAIGGTGDTLTGILSALVQAGFNPVEAASIAASANRIAGYYSSPTPATQILEIIQHIPQALERALDEKDIYKKHA